MSDYQLSQNPSFKEIILGYTDGWIPVDVLFWNCLHMSKLDNGDSGVIYAALRKDTSGVFQISKHRAEFRRSKRPDEGPNLDRQTVYCTGFPFNALKWENRQQLTDFFSQFPAVVTFKVREHIIFNITVKLALNSFVYR